MRTSLLLLLGLPALHLSALAEPVALSDWYIITGKTDVLLNNGDTNAPVLERIESRSLNSVVSHFPSITLEDGEALVLSFTVALEVSGSEATFPLFRFGLFHDTREAAGERDSRVLSDQTSLFGWSGFLVLNPGEPMATNPFLTYRRIPESGFSFVSTDGTDLTAPLNQMSGECHLTFQSGEPRTFTVTFSRRGTSLEMRGDHGAGTFSGTMPEAFADGYSASFNRFGLYATEADVELHTLTITDATITRLNH